MILRFHKIHKKFLPFLSLLIQFHNRINWPINQHQGRTIKEDNNQAEKFIRGSGVSIRGEGGEESVVEHVVYRSSEKFPRISVHLRPVKRVEIYILISWIGNWTTGRICVILEAANSSKRETWKLISN